MDWGKIDTIWRNNNPWAIHDELELWILARAMEGSMGYHLDELEQLCKLESQRLLDCLPPIDQHKLKQIKKNVDENGDHQKVISLRSALSEAYGVIGIALSRWNKHETYDPQELKEADKKAVDMIRAKIIDNPAFEEFT